jgi:hypothetical protein
MAAKFNMDFFLQKISIFDFGSEPLDEMFFIFRYDMLLTQSNKKIIASRQNT